jgi:lipopolysaccharide/colanic/teichoic acid biosynthesis glycosyltransferase
VKTVTSRQPTSDVSRRRSIYFASKRVIDVIGAAGVLAILLPLMPVIAALIRLDSPGRVFFVQTRVGKHGRHFKLYKFRTMDASTPAYAVSPDSDDHDDRVTRVGRFLRRSKLDELPQFLNVLRGEMSIVGPRPEMPFIADRYSSQQKARLKVLPGITGPWQISPHRHELIHRHIQYDLTYIAQQSLRLDCIVIAKTILLVVRSAVSNQRPAAAPVSSAPETQPRPTAVLASRPPAAAWDGGLVHAVAGTSHLSSRSHAGRSTRDQMRADNAHPGHSREIEEEEAPPKAAVVSPTDRDHSLPPSAHDQSRFHTGL